MTWHDELLTIEGDDRYKREGNFIYRVALAKTQNLASNNPWHTSGFTGRAALPYTTTAIETRLVGKMIGSILERYQLGPQNLIYDLGCSDGRLSTILLDCGFQRVLGADISFANVSKMAGANQSRSDRLLAVAENVLELPLAEGRADAIIMWGLLTCLPEPREALLKISRLLTDDGIIIFLEPILESVMVYALIMGDLGEFENIFKSSSRPSAWENKEDRYSLYPSRFWRKLVEESSFQILEKTGVNIFPSLVFGGLLQNQVVSDEEKEKLRVLMLDISEKCDAFYRQEAYVLRKGQ